MTIVNEAWESNMVKPAIQHLDMSSRSFPSAHTNK